jgi:hypothetical protein
MPASSNPYDAGAGRLTQRDSSAKVMIQCRSTGPPGRFAALNRSAAWRAEIIAESEPLPAAGTVPRSWPSG